MAKPRGGALVAASAIAAIQLEAGPHFQIEA
jgi:hypothetical protein